MECNPLLKSSRKYDKISKKRRYKNVFIKAFEIGGYMVKAKKTLLTSGIIDLIFTVVYGILGIVTIVIGLAMMGDTEESYGMSALIGVLFVAIAICSFFALALSIVSTILGLRCATKKQIEYKTSKVLVIIASVFNFVESVVFLISAVVFIAKETDDGATKYIVFAIAFVIALIRAICGGLKIKSLSDMKNLEQAAQTTDSATTFF